MDDKIQFKEIISGLDIELNINRNYSMFQVLLKKIFNRENNIPVYTENKKKIILTINIGNKILFIECYFIGVLFYDSLFTHSPYIMDRNFREETMNNQIKNYLFHMYDKKITNEILLKNQYFNDIKTKENDKIIFFNYLNHLLKYHTVDIKLFNTIIKRFKFEYLDNDTKFYDNYFIISDPIPLYLFYQLLEPDKYNAVFNFKYEKYRDSNVVLNYYILQNMINFNTFNNNVVENTKTKKDRYKKLKELNNNLTQYNKHCILSYLTFDDIKELVLD